VTPLERRIIKEKREPRIRCRGTIEEAVRRKRGTENPYAREHQLLIIPLPFWEYKRTYSGISGETQERYIN
jgi:hypothetical protein